MNYNAENCSVLEDKRLVLLVLNSPVTVTEFIFKFDLQPAEVYEDMIEDRSNTLKYELTGVPDTL